MSTSNWKRIERIFDEALARAPADRADFLDEACGSDQEVRTEVESLLASFDGAEGFMERPAVGEVADLLAPKRQILVDGKRLGHYQIVRELGAGGMGEIYLAYDSRLDRQVAIKLLPADFARDKQRVRRFAHEARAASALNHPNICVIYDVGKTDDGRDFIAMEHIAGITLRERIAQQRLSPGEAVSVGVQVAAALAAAHAAGIVHRDIKPENIMLRHDGYVKVLDFGLAKYQHPGKRKAGDEVPTVPLMQTDPGRRMGTVQYMSPEQLRDLPVDARTDIWSLGVVLHEMVTGQTPFAGTNSNESIALILERQPSTLTIPPDTVPAGFHQMVARAVAKEPADRYQTADEFAAELNLLQRQLGIEPGSTRPVRPLADRGATTRGDGRSTGAKPETRTRSLTQRSRIAGTAAHLLDEVRKHPKTSILTCFTGLALIVAFLYLPRSPVAPRSPAAKIELLTNSGKAVLAAISPDGDAVAYAATENEKQTLLLTGLTTHATTELLPGVEESYLGITYSPDGLYLYLTRRRSKNDPGILYQLALPGGAPVWIREGVDSPIAFSPQGERYAFVRLDQSGEYSLVVAPTYGGVEQILATRTGDRFSLDGPAWSPDGKTIVCAAGHWGNGYHMGLVEFAVADGKEKPLGDPRWFSVLQVGWSADQELVISAREQWTSPYQLWRISYPKGEASRLTNDTVEHTSVSLSRDGKKIVSTQSYQVGKLWVAPDGDAQRAKPVADKSGRMYGLSWVAGGKLVYSATDRSNLEISLFDLDGNRSTPLANNQGDSYGPVPSPDGRFIVFASNRTGSLNIWRVNAVDGSDPTQLTFSEGNSYPTISPDGQWVAFDQQTGPKPVIWRVSINGGDPVRLAGDARMPVFSPDGQLIACRYQEAIAIIPAQGGAPVKRLPIPIMDWQQVQWTADGSALTYIKTIGGTSNLWNYELTSGVDKQITAFNADKIFAYAWSPDRKQLACQRGNEVTDVILVGNQP